MRVLSLCNSMMARSVDYEDSERVVSGKKESSMDKVLLVKETPHNVQRVKEVV